jgi:thiamine-phosphate pyrophosphorylase
MSPLTDFLRLIVITDGSAACGAEERRHLLNRLDRALDGGATALMVRERGLSTRELCDFSEQVRERTRRHGAWLIVNDRVDIALAVEADAVHLGWQSLDIERVRALAGDRLRIGYSTHLIEQALACQARGADYITFGPVFFTPSKEGLVQVQGLDGVRRLCAGGLHIPCVGLGGITSDTAAQVRAQGAAGVAVIRAALDAPDPAQACRALRGCDTGPFQSRIFQRQLR